MALIGKIRKHFWFVLILLGLALAAFIIMDMTSAGSQGAQANPAIGNIAGQRISYEEFSQSESGLFQGSSNSLANRANLWEFYVEKAIVDSEAKKLGLGISSDELQELQFGPNYSSLIQQQLQSGSLTFQQLNEIKNAIDSETFTNPSFRLYWSELQKQIMKAQKQNKLTTMVQKAVFTPTWMAEEDYVMSNSTVDFAYVKVPFDALEETVELTEDDIDDFIASKKAAYTKENETRSIEYVSFDVVATAADTAAIKTAITEKIEALKNAENDSLFAIANNGVMSNLYFSSDQLPEVAKDDVKALAVGDIFGPYEDGGLFNIIKKIDQRAVPDSVSARHILRRVTAGDNASLVAAHAYIDSIEIVYNSRAESFDSLAIKNSEDGSAATGGELGTFQQGYMVSEFNDVCFIEGKAGRKLYKAVTQFGVHLIKIDEQIFENRDPKYKLLSIPMPIVPSEATQDSIYDRVADILAANKNYESLKTVVDADDNLIFESGKDLESDGFQVGKLDADNTSRQMVKWAFNPSTEIGDVSPEIYTYSDKINYYDSKYVLISLTEIIPKGLVRASNASDQIENLVLTNKKGKIIAEKIAGKDMQTIATEYNITIDTLEKINLAANFIPGLGNEPEVSGVAYGLELNQESRAIVGNSGVFVIKPINRPQVGDPFNIPQLQATAQTADRGNMLTLIMDALKRKVKVEDNRATFF